jgi:cyclic pyranopterin phosphate synthase
MLSHHRAPVLRDPFGRGITYLRVSLTDRCNLRCVYCMPLSGLRFIPGHDLLTADEIERVVRAAVRVGFVKVRLTGGEPTLRPDVVEIVARLARIDGLRDLAMTTNGLRLVELAQPLAQAGLRRVNIHVDTLMPDNLSRLMRWGKLESIWSGIVAAEEVGLTPIKLNAVVVRGYNDQDVTELAALTLQRDWHVRFIELMPLGTGAEAQVAIDRYVSNLVTRQRVEAELGELQPVASADPADEATNYRLPAARGIVGFISPVSAPYCGNCNRMRLTADGKLHACLLHDDQLDVRDMLRAGATTDRIATRLREAVRAKPTGHELQMGVHTRHSRMYQLGG